MTGWQRILALFVATNLVAVPIAGRLAGIGMGMLAEAEFRALAVALAVVATALILAVNVLIVRAAARAEMPRRLEAGLALYTLAQFVVTIGFGLFSLVDFAIALPSLVAWATA